HGVGLVEVESGLDIERFQHTVLGRAKGETMGPIPPFVVAGINEEDGRKERWSCVRIGTVCHTSPPFSRVEGPASRRHMELRYVGYCRIGHRTSHGRVGPFPTTQRMAHATTRHSPAARAGIAMTIKKMRIKTWCARLESNQRPSASKFGPSFCPLTTSMAWVCRMRQS